MYNLNKKLLILSIVTIFTINNVLAKEFKDVPKNFWAYKQIDKMTNENIISGYNSNLYKPNNFITRAEYAEMIIKAIKQENIPIEKMYTFEDVDINNRTWGYIERAVNLDILTPIDESHFYPKDFVTRTEIITFLVNILKSEDITKQEAIIALQNKYADFDDIPDWFKETAGKAEVLKVIAQEPSRINYLDYDKYITRAQMAVFLDNLKTYTESYIQEKIDAERSPKIGEGIIIENVIREDDVVTIPEKSVLPIMITGQISSKSSRPGEMFQAKFANNIIDYEHHILLSKNTILIGKILDTTKATYFINNGELIFELSAANKNNNLTRILGAAEYQAPIAESNKTMKAAKTVLKGRNFVAKDGQILYIKLYKPMRVNIVTGEILN